MNSIQIKYFLIHCEEHRERLKNIKDLKGVIGEKIEIFKGYFTQNIETIFNTKLNFFKIHDNNLKMEQNVISKPGEIGCYLSHHMLIKHILETKKQGYSVIFEDDVTCKNTLHDEITKIINNMNSLNLDWDIIFLGNITKNHGEKIIDNIYSIDKNNVCTGTHALLINNKNIHKIYESNCNIIHAIDFQYKINIDKKVLNGYVIFRPICFQDKNFKSNIQ